MACYTNGRGRFKNELFFVKLAQGILFTRYLICKYKRFKTSICPACKNTVEKIRICSNVIVTRHAVKDYMQNQEFCKKTRIGDKFTGQFLTYIKSYCHDFIFLT